MSHPAAVRGAIAAALAAFAVAPAHAYTLDEIRVGIAAHNVRFGQADEQSDETGPNLEAEAVWGRLERLRRIGAPRPYAMVSANTAGATSYAAAGLYWRWAFAENWALEPGVGLAVHDGATDNPYAPGDARADVYEAHHQMLGSSVLFRDTLALERRVGEGRFVGLAIEHLSNGGALFGHHSNQSLNEIAVRYTVRLR